MTIESLPAKLLPCPFCEYEPTIENIHADANQGDKWGGVICSCGVKGPEVRTGYGPVVEWADRAIKEWNTRAALATQPKDGELLALAETAEDAFRDDVLDALWKRGGNGDPVYMAANDFLLAYQRLRALASHRAVDEAMIYRAKQAWPGYYAPDTDDEWRTVLTAALQPDSGEG